MSPFATLELATYVYEEDNLQSKIRAHVKLCRRQADEMEKFAETLASGLTARQAHKQGLLTIREEKEHNA